MTSVETPLDFGQRAHHQALRDADAKLAGDAACSRRSAGARPSRARPATSQRAARVVIGVAQGQQALLDPVVQRQIGGGGGGRQQQGDGLGEIAHRVVALAEQPVRDAGLFDGPLRQLARFQQALGTAADQEVDGPGGVLGRRGGEVALERRHLVVGLGGLVERGVEFGEGLHGSASGHARSRGIDGHGAGRAVLFAASGPAGRGSRG